jgi:hypothetical protein
MTGSFIHHRVNSVQKNGTQKQHLLFFAFLGDIDPWQEESLEGESGKQQSLLPLRS